MQHHIVMRTRALSATMGALRRITASNLLTTTAQSHQVVPQLPRHVCRRWRSLHVSGSVCSSSRIPRTTNHGAPSKNLRTRVYSTEDSPKLAVPSELKTQSGRDLVLSQPALVVTREYEWANILVGFEQANRYTIRSAPAGEIVGYLAEDTSMGSAITRNVMRTRRPFKATVLDKDGNTLFTIRRPIFLVSSSVFVETPDGEVLGEVHMSWHVWRRRYNLYVEKQQFASVDSGFLAVDFDMRDVDGRRIASVNKDFTGFAREIFTDARQYVLRLDPSFGLSADGVLVSDAATVNVAQDDISDVTLGHRERATILATAIAIDFDYFSLHSRSPMPVGMMMPVGGGGGVPPVGGGAAGAGTAAGADILSDAASTGEAAPGADPFPETQPGGGFSDGGFSDGFTNDAPPDAGGGESEWATFEEPDHGFEDPYADQDSWTSGSEGFSSDLGGDGGAEEAGGGLSTVFDFLRDMFTGSD